MKMLKLKTFTVTLFAIVSVISVHAQSNPSATCQAANGMPNVNASLFAGNWYEEFRVPAKNVSCVQMHIDLINNQQQLSIKTIYSASQSGFLMDKSDQATINVSEVNVNTGFNVSNSNANGANTTYKILSTDYNTNAVLCAYQNASDPSTSVAFILARNQIVNATWLMEVKNNASQILSSFSNNSAANITQSKSCYVSSATSSVPVLAALFGTFYAMLKLVYLI